MKENNLVKQTISSVPYRENECCYVFYGGRLLCTQTRKIYYQKSRSMHQNPLI